MNMKKTLLLATALYSMTVLGQTPQTYKGPYSIGVNDGEATYTYYEQNGERVLDGNFTFNDNINNFSVTGKYEKGKEVGAWTRKRIYSLYQGVPQKKTDLRWNLVKEVSPFQEITETTSENWSNGKLNGITTTNQNIKNSWGFPAPGGASATIVNTKKVYANGTLVSIDCSRKKNEKVNLSFKGVYKNNVADGAWQFNDGANLYSYNFKNGYLKNYEIKQQGTGKVTETNKFDIDTVLINSFYGSSSDAISLNIYRDVNYKPMPFDAKLYTQKINETTSILKLCYQNTSPANFQNLNNRPFTQVFGNITPYQVDAEEVFAFSSEIKCEILNEDAYKTVRNIQFNSVKDEFQFLKSACSKNNSLFGIDWANISSSHYDAGLWILQLKYYLYSNKPEELKKAEETRKNYENRQSMALGFSIKNSYFNTGLSEQGYYDYLLILEGLLTNDEASWKKICDVYFNSTVKNDSWQAYVKNNIEELKNTSFDPSKIETLKNYLNQKEESYKKEIENYLANIKEIKVGNQTWMAEDLNLIPKNNPNFVIYPQDTIKKIKNLYKIKLEELTWNIETYPNTGRVFLSAQSGKGQMYFNKNSMNKNICPKGWRVPTKADWDIFIKALGGDINTAGKMMLKGKESGFETNFGIIAYDDRVYGNVLNTNYARYIFFDDNKIGTYNFNGYGNPNEGSYFPCRCIKE